MKNKMEASSLKVSDLVQELKRVKTELQYATDAELTSNKAMDDLVLALKEVAADCSVTKEKLTTVETELEGARSECKEWKEKHEETQKEAEWLRIEAEKSLIAWNGKESLFVNIIKRGEGDKKSLLDENHRLLVAAENLSKKAKEENDKVRDILKQAISEANVAKETAGLARAENSDLKDALLDKEEELQYALKEIERVKYNECVANENVKKLNKLLSEIQVAMEEEKQRSLTRQDSMQVVVAEKKTEEKKKEHNIDLKKMIGKTCGFSIMKLAHNHYHNKHKETTVEEEANDDSREGNAPALDSYLFKGSIFDVAQTHHKRRSSCTFSEEVVTINSEDLESLEGNHFEEGELSDNVAVAARKKKAFIRRFGDLLVRKK